MGITPHDLLKIQPAGFCTEGRPAWIDHSLKSAPFVVVRRAPLVENQLPVGLRGSVREERCAGVVATAHILTCIKPEMLAKQKSWRENTRFSEKLISTLEIIDRIVCEYNLLWGPTGSVGFELGTGQQVVSPASDLDFLLRAGHYMPPSVIREMYHEFQHAKVKLDMQLETPQGAVALAEYMSGMQPFLLRTLFGPRLINKPRQALWGGKPI